MNPATFWDILPASPVHSAAALFNFAVDRGLTEKNPIAGYKHRVKRNSRERYLTDPEIGQLWRACR